MRKVEISEAEAPWAEYVQDREPIVLTRDGQPVAAVVPIEGIDLETLMVSVNPNFIDIIQRSRQSQKEHGRIFLEDVRQELGI
ncbi:MAG: type II toxin-antitoxin system prevent-host-death family antitoxin [Hormoscilla sp. SP5CHS1]|nr:type II toxin-antitoxin system prevent-host-death family antitoxin [Hormoscilla sp. SP5CHS1]